MAAPRRAASDGGCPGRGGSITSRLATVSESREDCMRAPLFDAAIALVVLVLTAAPAPAQTKFPDWSGQWSRVPDGGVPRYDPSKPIRRQDAPLKPEYRARHEATMRDQDAGGFGLDTNYACFPSTMPRTMSGTSRMEFLFAPG